MLQDRNTSTLYTKDLLDEAQKVLNDCKTAFTEVDNTFRAVVKVDGDGKG